MNGQRGQRPSFQNGLEFAQAKRKETQKHQREKRMLHQKKKQRKKIMRRRRRKKRRKRRRNKMLLHLCSRGELQIPIFVTAKHSIRVIASAPRKTKARTPSTVSASVLLVTIVSRAATKLESYK